ncbi:Trypsin [Pleurocapsa sp. PCC 7327]|uniref:trypsin-like serine protease n=1 Tax=Pleurocapsa sp. PCC 7327 TaxID=118163 RepID=UPI00029F81A4|nr:trypsin-like serine protease [Pleurocapsa sp. PCC 7327]AFY79207.1 Trypsin [Pleurocapsa sp. PCC 7327]
MLTAAHCAYNPNNPNLSVILGQNQSAYFNVGSAAYPVASAQVYPDWMAQDWSQPQLAPNLAAGRDIALLQLSTPVLDVAPALLMTGANEVGRIGDYVGFGNTGNGRSRKRSFDGIKRGAQNVVDSAGFVDPNGARWLDTLLVADFDSPNQLSNRIGSPTPLPLECSVAPIDSGGGLFIDGYLAGVTSFMMDTSGNSYLADYSDLMASTRVSSFVPWIAPITGLAPTVASSASLSGSGTVNNLNSVSALAASSQQNQQERIPEPTISIGLLLVSGLMALFRFKLSSK